TSSVVRVHGMGNGRAQKFPQTRGQELELLADTWYRAGATLRGAAVTGRGGEGGSRTLTKTFRRRNAPNPFTALYHLKTRNLAVPLSHPLLQVYLSQRTAGHP